MPKIKIEGKVVNCYFKDGRGKDLPRDDAKRYAAIIESSQECLKDGVNLTSTIATLEEEIKGQEFTITGLETTVIGKQTVIDELTRELEESKVRYSLLSDEHSSLADKHDKLYELTHPDPTAVNLAIIVLMFISVCLGVFIGINF